MKTLEGILSKVDGVDAGDKVSPSGLEENRSDESPFVTEKRDLNQMRRDGRRSTSSHGRLDRYSRQCHLLSSRGVELAAFGTRRVEEEV